MALDPIQRRILALREEQVPAAGRTFTIRRLADVSFSALKLKHRDDPVRFAIELVRESVVGWDMDEQTLFAGGSDAAVPFSTDVLMTWLDDQEEVFGVLFTAALDAVNRHKARLEASRKN